MKTLALTSICSNQSEVCLASRLAYPLTLSMNLAFIYGLYSAGLDIGSLFLIGFFVSLASLAVLERVLPYRTDWQASGRDWAINGIYFLINGATDNTAKLITASIAIYLAPAVAADFNAWMFATSVLLALLVNDFIGYWWHRLGHEIKLLWRFHGIHHVPNKIFMFNNNTVHFVDILISGILSGTAMVLLGFSEEAIALALYIASFHSFFAHANADVRMGALGYILMGPEHHRFHHSTEQHEAMNYGAVTALWDQVFGTFLYRPGEAPREIGVKGPHRFPESHKLLSNIASPFLKTVERG